MVGLSSSYTQRGIKYRNSQEVLSATSNLQWENGFHSGLWIGQQTEDIGFRGSLEMDFWFGYMTSLSDDIALDLAYTRHTFPRGKLLDFDWEEVSGSLHFTQQLSITLARNRNHFYRNDNGTLSEIVYRKLFNNFLLDLNLGSFQNSYLENSVQFYELGISQQYSDLHLRVSFASSKHDQMTQLPFGYQYVSNHWLAAVKYQF